ncbi:MAG: FAD/NAD(P)-binding oxidoreductase [Gemmatimonadaceae bacterium]
MQHSARRAQRALILGGGVGGVVAANRLRKLLPRTHDVVLVERERYHVFQPSLLWLAVGWRRPDQIRRPLERLRRKGIDVVTGEVTRIEPATRSVVAGSQTLTGDALIVALGAELGPDSIPGLSAAGHNLYTLDGAIAIKRALDSFRSGSIVVLTAAPAYKCPAAPYEAAMLIEGALRRRGLRESTQVNLYAAEPGPMGVAGPHVSTAVRQIVESKGVNYHPGHQVVSVDPEKRRLAFANGVAADFDLLIYVPPHRAPALVRADLGNETGWIPVNRTTFETSFPGVFAIGDVTTVPLSVGKPLPKAGVFAHAQAEVVSANIANAWTGRGTRRGFDGHGQCFVETGDGRAGYGAGNFYGEPAPQIALHRPSVMRHWGKVLFEKQWLYRWF